MGKQQVPFCLYFNKQQAFEKLTKIFIIFIALQCVLCCFLYCTVILKMQGLSAAEEIGEMETFILCVPTGRNLSVGEVGPVETAAAEKP